MNYSMDVSAAASYVQGCYVTDWSVYRSAPYSFTPSKIPVGLCTHIFYAFAAVNAVTYEAQLADDWADVGLGLIDQLNDLKTKQPGLKSILSFGGWTESQTGIYSQIAGDPSKRSRFVKSAWALASEYGFDGVDLDWEYPESNDRTNYIELLRQLKSEGGSGKLLTAAVPAENDNFIGYNVPEMNKYLDLFNIMAYDFYGVDTKKVNHHASFSQMNTALLLWNQRGAARNKMVVGIPAYGVGWIVKTCGQGQATYGPAPAQPYTREPANAAFFELIEMTGKVVSTSDGPYLQATANGRTLCYGYDNPESITKKMNYVKSQGFRGAFTWTVDFDDSSVALHNAIKNGLTAAVKPNVSADSPVIVDTCKNGATRKCAFSPSSYFTCIDNIWTTSTCESGRHYNSISGKCEA